MSFNNTNPITTTPFYEADSTTNETQQPVFNGMPVTYDQGPGLGRVVYVLPQDFMTNICDRYAENAYAFHASNFIDAGAQLIAAIRTVMDFEKAANILLSNPSNTPINFTSMQKCIQNLKQAQEARYPAPDQPYIDKSLQDTPEFMYMRKYLEHCVSILETCLSALEKPSTDQTERLSSDWFGWERAGKQVQIRLAILQTLIEEELYVVTNASELCTRFSIQVQCFATCMAHIVSQWIQLKYANAEAILGIIENAGFSNFSNLVSIDSSRYTELQQTSQNKQKPRPKDPDINEVCIVM